MSSSDPIGPGECPCGCGRTGVRAGELLAPECWPRVSSVNRAAVTRAWRAYRDAVADAVAGPRRPEARRRYEQAQQHVVEEAREMREAQT